MLNPGNSTVSGSAFGSSVLWGIAPRGAHEIPCLAGIHGGGPALYAPPIRRIATYRKMRQALLEFSPICAATGDLRPATIARWIQLHPERRPETTASLLRNLAAACAYGVMTGAIAFNPFAWRSPTAWVDWDVPELDPPVHSAEEIARVLALADQEASTGDWKAERLRALVYTYAFTGARKRELLGLRCEDVDLVAGTITIRTNRRRGLKTRASSATLPIARDLRRVLAHWLPLARCEWVFPGVRRAGPWLEGYPGYKAIDEIKALGRRRGRGPHHRVVPAHLRQPGGRLGAVRAGVTKTA